MPTPPVLVTTDLPRQNKRFEGRQYPLKRSFAIFLLALLIRLLVIGWPILVRKVPPTMQRVESVRIGLSLAEQGTYADAYGPGVGPTAHCVPAQPLILASLIRVFGSGETGALALFILNAIVTSLGYALLPILSVNLGLGAESGLLAGFIGAVLPIDLAIQTAEVFDAPYTFVALVLLCCLWGRYWMDGKLKAADGARFGFATGVVCLLNASVFAVFICWVLVGVRRFRLQLPRFGRFIVTAAVCLLAALTPWAIRNRIVLGSWIFLRSNFGLELYVSNCDEAGPNLEGNVLTPWFARIHPASSEVERREVRRIGEAAYQKVKLHQALDWISTHPQRFLRLSAQRLFLTLVPQMRAWQRLVVAAYTLLGLVGLAWLFKLRHPAALFFLAILVGFPAVNIFVQASARYRFPIEWVLLLLGCKFLLDQLRRVSPNL